MRKGAVHSWGGSSWPNISVPASSSPDRLHHCPDWLLALSWSPINYYDLLRWLVAVWPALITCASDRALTRGTCSPSAFPQISKVSISKWFPALNNSISPLHLRCNLIQKEKRPLTRYHTCMTFTWAKVIILEIEHHTSLSSKQREKLINCLC